jgi:hypothetical protein
MIDPVVILSAAKSLLIERGLAYDDEKSGVEENFARAASIASNWLDKPLSARDVVVVMASVKMSRLAISPDHEDSWVDLCNYVAFAAGLSLPSNGNGA